MKLEKWTWKIVSIEASSSNRDNQDGKIKCLITFAGMKPRLIFLHANFSLFSFLDPPQDIERIILIISWLNEILIIRKRVSNLTRDFFSFFFFSFTSILKYNINSFL